MTNAQTSTDNVTLNIQYGNRWTDHVIDGGTGRLTGETRVRIDLCGYGEAGLTEAKRVVADTRAWQPGQDLTADAEVVHRHVSDWQPLPKEGTPASA